MIFHREVALLGIMGAALTMGLPTASARADDKTTEADISSGSLDHRYLNPLSEIGLGLAAQTIGGTGTTIKTVAPTIEVIRHFPRKRYGPAIVISPLFQSQGGLFGIYASGGLNYTLFGKRSETESVESAGHPFLSRTVPGTTWAGSVDLAISALPVFGSTTTATYSGPSVAICLQRLTGFGWKASARYAHLAVSAKSLNLMAIEISTPFYF
jgi:hypothetical protein